VAMRDEAATTAADQVSPSLKANTLVSVTPLHHWRHLTPLPSDPRHPMARAILFGSRCLQFLQRLGPGKEGGSGKRQ
jgi:hypothetical protein